MDTEIFWTAFGAIGTTIGSLVTAIAVLVAVRQYRQPLHKRLKISFSEAIPIDENYRMSDYFFYQISIVNTGIRNSNISCLYLNIENKNFLLLNAQVPFLPKATLPVILHPEQGFQFNIDPQIIATTMSHAINKNDISASSRVRVLVSDASGKKYFAKTKRRAIDFAQYKGSIL